MRACLRKKNGSVTGRISSDSWMQVTSGSTSFVTVEQFVCLRRNLSSPSKIQKRVATRSSITRSIIVRGASLARFTLIMSQSNQLNRSLSEAALSGAGQWNFFEEGAACSGAPQC